MTEEYALDDTEVPSDERDALLAIAHGAVVSSGGRSIKRLLSSWIEAVLTAGLGPVLYGVYAFGWRILGMLMRFANFGANRTLQRDVPALADEPDRQRRIVGLGYVTTIVASTILGGGLFVAADWINTATLDNPDFPLALRLFAVVFVLRAFLRLYSVLLRASKAANAEVLFNLVLRPGIRLLAAAGAIAAGYSLLGVIGGIAGAFGVLVVVGYPVTVRLTGIRPTVRGLRSEARYFYDHAIPSALEGIGGLLRTRIDVLLIGILLTETDAGVYNVVLVLIGFAAIPLRSFNHLMSPVASDLYSDGKVEALNRVYTTVTRLVVTTTLPVIVVLAVNGTELLGIFGDTYRQGYAVLLVFLVGRLIGSAVGATGILLSMTNNQYAKMLLEWLLAVLNVVLTYVFVLEFGLIGAALGTSLAIAIQNLLQVGVLYWFEGLWPFDATFLKPLGAGVGMAAVMVAVHAAIPGAVSAIPGVLLGIVVFYISLRAFGFNARDAFIIRELRGQYRDTAVQKFIDVQSVWRDRRR